MPVVPLRRGQVADPFNTRVQGKDQSRLPSGTMHPGPMPSQTEMLMAAALMDERGLLFDTTPVAPPSSRYFIERERDKTDEKPIPSKPVEPDRTGPPPRRLGKNL